MAPKKDKRKVLKTNDTPAEPKGPMFTEVERTFLELQLTEANRKLARLRSTLEEYEAKNEKLQKDYDTLDKDRADIITYLKKTINNKNEEINELKSNVKSLEETRESETRLFKKTVKEMETNFQVMKDQLTSECKLLTSKLNTLEEFRITRDTLMKKFEKQQQEFKDQEMTYRRKLYETEKKFVIGKDTLRKEMESRLMQLAQDFQDGTELKIAATTHRVIRENIAINNELEKILETQAKLANQNENFKKREHAARIAMELAEEERDQAIKKNVAQIKLIDKLVSITKNVKKDKALMQVQNDDIDSLKANTQRLTKENDNLIFKVRVLEQNLHAKMNEQSIFIVHASKIVKENKKLKNILKDAVINIQAALKLDQWAINDSDRGIMDRQDLLLRLLRIVTQYRDTARAESIETLVSFEKVYEKGDLGFVPKPKSEKSAISKVSSISTNESEETFKCPSGSSSTSDLGSLKTVPSMHLIPISSEHQNEHHDKATLLSFVTSSKSTTSDTVEEEESDSNDMDRQLEQSKLEVQRAILKDLVYAQKRASKLIPLENEADDPEIEKQSVREENLQAEQVEDETNAEETFNDEGETRIGASFEDDESDLLGNQNHELVDVENIALVEEKEINEHKEDEE